MHLPHISLWMLVFPSLQLLLSVSLSRLHMADADLANGLPSHHSGLTQAHEGQLALLASFTLIRNAFRVTFCQSCDMLLLVMPSRECPKSTSLSKLSHPSLTSSGIS